MIALPRFPVQVLKGFSRLGYIEQRSLDSEMRPLKKKKLAPQFFSLAYEYIHSYFSSFYYGNDLNSDKVFFLFLGHQRSGHSIIGALLDAHPNVICSHELNVMKYLYLNFSKRQIFSLIIQNAKRNINKERGGYTYTVNNQWQGLYSSVLAAGDKKGEGTVFWLHNHPQLYERLEKKMGTQVKFFLVIRNPFDNITTISLKNSLSLVKAIDYYFSIWSMIKNITSRIPAPNILHLYHEDFIEDPVFCLSEACAFLGLRTPGRYLEDCSRLVLKQPKITRLNVNWPRHLVETVLQRAGDIDLLSHYRFHA